LQDKVCLWRRILGAVREGVWLKERAVQCCCGCGSTASVWVRSKWTGSSCSVCTSWLGKRRSLDRGKTPTRGCVTLWPLSLSGPLGLISTPCRPTSGSHPGRTTSSSNILAARDFIVQLQSGHLHLIVQVARRGAKAATSGVEGRDERCTRPRPTGTIRAV
jgi:hypothetical protein